MAIDESNVYVYINTWARLQQKREGSKNLLEGTAESRTRAGKEMGDEFSEAALWSLGANQHIYFFKNIDVCDYVELSPRGLRKDLYTHGR